MPSGRYREGLEMNGLHQIFIYSNENLFNENINTIQNCDDKLAEKFIYK